MCGILAVMRKDGKAANKQTLKRYHKQKSRGQDGFGYVAFDTRVRAFKRFQFEHDFKVKLEKETAANILAHHRFPTSVLNVAETAHPIPVVHKELQYTYYVVHNGHISNTETLKEKHEKLGYTYVTEVSTHYKTVKGKKYHDANAWNDSESLAIELARTIESKQVMSEARGAIAYIVLQCEGVKPIALYYGTNGGNPLTLQDDANYMAICSEGGTRIEDNQCFRVDCATGAVAEVALNMEPIYRASSGFGADSYKGWNSSTDYSYSHTKFDTSAFNGTIDKTEPKKVTNGGIASMSIDELETECEEIQNDLVLARQELSAAIDVGDSVEEQEWLHEVNQLNAQYDKLERELERKLNASPVNI